VDSAIEFVAPRGVGEEPFDAELDFLYGLLFTDGQGEALGDFRGPLGKIFGDVEKNLRAIVGSGFGPAFGFAGRFDGVADVFAITEGRFAEEFAFAAVNRDAVAGIGTGLFAADVKFHGSVDVGDGIGNVRR